MINKYDVPLQLDNENPITAVLSYISPGMEILEMGSAAGRLTHYLSKEMSCNVSIVEIDRPSFNKAMQYASDGICANLDGEEWYKYFSGRKFDAVVFADVIEHLNKPLDVINESKALLKDGGKLLFSIPNIAYSGIISQLINNNFIYTETGILDHTHVKFYTYHSFHQLLKNCGMFIYSEKAIYKDINIGDWLDFERLDDNNKTLLRNREFSDVYEYVFAAVKDEWYETNKNELSIEHINDFKGVTAVSTLYLDNGEGFRPDNLIQTNMLINSENKFSVTFDLSGIENIKQIRFDPCDYECKIKLLSINGKSPKSYSALGSYTVKNGINYFATKDPGFIIEDKELLSASKLLITGEINKLTNNDLIDIIKEQKTIFTEKIGFEHKEVEKLTSLHKQDIKSLDDFNRLLIAKSAEAVSLNEALIAKNAEAVSLNEALIIKSAEAVSINEALITKNVEANSLKEELVSKGDLITSLNRELAVKNDQITSLNEELIIKSTEAASYKSGLIAKTEEAASLKEQLLSKMEEAASLAESINVKTEEVYRTQIQLMEMREHIENTVEAYNLVINSKCWKITKPLRIFLDAAKACYSKIRIRRIMLLLNKVKDYYRINGLKNTVFKIVNKFKSKIHREKVIKPYSIIVDGSVEIKPISVSVVIPTFNAGHELNILLDSLQRQENVGFLELIIVDSGSSDNTLDIARSHGADIVSISQKEFTHSFARNLGAKQANGEYILFMTQDALPDSSMWLKNMYRPILSDSGIVAVSCGELPKPDADLFGLACSWGHARFMGVLDCDRIMEMPSTHSVEDIRRNSNLNDVACLVKKRVFEEFEYRFNYAEDLDLGIRLIKGGYRLALLGTVRVIHSHNRPEYYYFKRAFVERKAFYDIFPDIPLANISESDFLLGAKSLFLHVLNIVSHLSSISDELNVEKYISICDEIFRKSVQNLTFEGNLLYNPTMDYIDLIQTIESKCKTLIVNNMSEAGKVAFNSYFQAQSGMILDYMRNHIKVVSVHENKMFCKSLFCVCANATGDILGYTWLTSHDKNSLLFEIYDQAGKGV